MATYVYETIPRHADESPQRFEIVQSMKDAALATHPETGQPVRRVVMGGYGLINGRDRSTPTSSPVPSCSPGCACHRSSKIPSI